MKKSWIILSILPVAAFGHQSDEDVFYIADLKDEALVNIAYEEDDLEENLPSVFNMLDLEEEFGSQGLSLLEIDEMDEELLPWSKESLASEEVPAFIEKKAKELAQEFDDAYAYDLPANTRTGQYEPSFEKVPEEKNWIGSGAITEQSLVPEKKISQKDALKKKREAERFASFSEYLKQEEKEINISSDIVKNKRLKPTRNSSKWTERRKK